MNIDGALDPRNYVSGVRVIGYDSNDHCLGVAMLMWDFAPC